MRIDLLGDSFDIVKQSLLRWLSACGPWSAFPMFTHEVTDKDVAAYSRLLGVPVISGDVLNPETQRVSYFTVARDCKTHLFLDPDTGLRFRRTNRKKLHFYLLGEELVRIAQSQQGALTLVFDKSVARGNEQQDVDAKLRVLTAAGLYGGAYLSQACFILVGRDGALAKQAFRILRNNSGLPSNRFVEREASVQGGWS